MIKNVIVNGTVYNGIDTVKLKNSEGGDYSSFVETSDATANAEDISAGKIAYVNGEKVIGTKIDGGDGETTVNLQTKTVDPKTTQQTITPDSGYTGLSGVTVNAVTSSIDSNIQASNIKKGVSILGVAGSLEQSVNGGGETVVTNFPFPHNNIMTGSFTPTENEETHSIEVPFDANFLICIIDNMDENPALYAGAAWIYMKTNAGPKSSKDEWAVYRYNYNQILTGTKTAQAREGNTFILNGNCVQAGYYFYAGRTYNWVA